MKRTLFNFIGTSFLIFLPYIGLGQNLSQYVNPFIVTAGSDFASPGAALPFGMVHIGPKFDNWPEYNFLGFAHHNGIKQPGDVFLMPFIGNFPQTGIVKSDINRASVSTSPGYYKVKLEKGSILTEISTSLRAGIHKYTFPASAQGNIMIDFTHKLSAKDVKCTIQTNGSNEVLGSLQTWDNSLYFVARFSESFIGFAIAKNGKVEKGLRKASTNDAKAFLRFDTQKEPNILVKIGFSKVSIDGAKKNLETEIPGWNFDKVHEKATGVWETALGKIEVEGGQIEQTKAFYTALYHGLLYPSLAMDVDGRYRGADNKIHQAHGFDYFDLLSIQDLGYTTQALLSLIYPQVNNNIKQSLLKKHQQSTLVDKSLGIPHFLIGNTGQVEIEELYKILTNKNIESKYKSRVYNYFHHYGFVPLGKCPNPIAKTLAYSYQDWCLALMARWLDKSKDYERFLSSAINYRNLFDSTEHQFYPRNKYGLWDRDNVEPNVLQQDFIPWHDVNGLIELVGGNDVFVKKLDDYFGKASKNDSSNNLSLQFRLANLYNHVGQPWKAQSHIRQLINNIDLSALQQTNLAASYIFSAMGIFPANPVSNSFVLGSPVFERITIHLSDDEEFEIEAQNSNEVNKYIQYAELNRNLYSQSYINRGTIKDKGKLFLKMVGVPSYEWAIQPSQRAFDRAIPKGLHVLPKENVFMPYDSTLTRVFQRAKQITLKSETPAADIHYSLNAVTPSRHTAKYNSPIKITESQRLKAIAIKDSVKSEINVINYVRAYLDAKINNGDGQANIAILTDGKLSSGSLWINQSFAITGDSICFNIDLGTVRSVKNIILSYRSNKAAYKGAVINYRVEIPSAKSHETWTEVLDVTPGMVLPNNVTKMHLPVKKSARYFRLALKNLTKEPGVQLYLDEIMLEY